MLIKFKFYLRSGKEFECIEEIDASTFVRTISVIKQSMREGIDGMLCFNDCCVRLAECAVVEWEELNEPETEKGE